MAKTEPLHENLAREHRVRQSSDRAFGVVFTTVFVVIGLWPLIGIQEPRWWAIAIAGAFGTLALIRPHWLAPLNRGWTKVGLLLHKVVNPVVMGAIFYLAVVPTGLALRWLGKDPLRLKWDDQTDSYWITRDPPGPAPDTMKNQF